MPLPERAKEIGALALFGETYGEDVRVVEIGGPWSRELCGGTHVERSSQIGTVVVTSDSSVGAGNRRVEARRRASRASSTSPASATSSSSSARMLKASPTDVPAQVQKLVDRVRSRREGAGADQVGRARRRRRPSSPRRPSTSTASPSSVTGPRAPAAETSARIALDIRGRLQDRPAVVVVIGTAGDKPSAVVALNDAAQERGLAANDLIGVIGEHIGGRGGGKADVAQGGGTDLGGIEAALTAVQARLARRLTCVGVARLGVDVGDVRIGVAVCDPDGMLATPVETVPAGPGAVARLAAIVAEHDALECVVGLPLSLSGREGPAAAKVRAFATGLRDAIDPVPVRLFDERMSTMTAGSAARERTVRRRQARDHRSGRGHGDPADSTGRRTHARDRPGRDLVRTR